MAGTALDETALGDFIYLSSYELYSGLFFCQYNFFRQWRKDKKPVFYFLAKTGGRIYYIIVSG